MNKLTNLREAYPDIVYLYAYRPLADGLQVVFDLDTETFKGSAPGETERYFPAFRPYVDDLLAGFYCDVDGSTQITLDTNELKEAVWVKREDVEGQPHDLSLTNEMMVVFREGREPVGYLYRQSGKLSQSADRDEQS